MLESIISYLQAKLQGTNYFEKVWGLCVLKENPTLKIAKPVFYNGANEYEDVTNFDNYNGSAYFRKNGDISISKEEGQFNLTGCDDVVKIIYPIKVVVCVPREKVSCDDAYADDLLCQTVIAELQNKTSALKRSVNAFNAAILVSKYSTDTLKILNEESGQAKNDINYKFIYASIELNVELIIDKNCIGLECAAY